MVSIQKLKSQLSIEALTNFFLKKNISMTWLLHNTKEANLNISFIK